MTKRKNIKIPEYNTTSELRDILIKWTLELVVNLKAECLKKGNIRKPQIKKAKLKEYEVTLQGIRQLNSIIKDKAIDELQDQYLLLRDIIREDHLEKNSEIFELSAYFLERELKNLNIIAEGD